jgi:hypothetical protein
LGSSNQRAAVVAITSITSTRSISFSISQSQNTSIIGAGSITGHTRATAGDQEQKQQLPGCDHVLKITFDEFEIVDPYRVIQLGINERSWRDLSC